ncbi:MAG: hypothetical protein OXT67_10120 [Zetaproteobacteria bacterium]|nr:hypothetical protein [Zetaproteobacteria bacterium]
MSHQFVADIVHLGCPYVNVSKIVHSCRSAMTNPQLNFTEALHRYNCPAVASSILVDACQLAYSAAPASPSGGKGLKEHLGFGLSISGVVLIMGSRVLSMHRKDAETFYKVKAELIDKYLERVQEIISKSKQMDLNHERLSIRSHVLRTTAYQESDFRSDIYDQIFEDHNSYHQQIFELLDKAKTPQGFSPQYTEEATQILERLGAEVTNRIHGKGRFLHRHLPELLLNLGGFITIVGTTLNAYL